MLKSNLGKLIVCILTVVLLALVINTSFANSSFTLDQIRQKTDNSNVQTIPEGQTTTEPENQVTENLNTNTNTNTNVPATTPYTGIESDFALILVAIFAGSAVFAYKKIKNYND